MRAAALILAWTIVGWPAAQLLAQHSADRLFPSTLHCLSVEVASGSVQIRTDGEWFAGYDFSSYAKPILYPLKGPGGVDVTRNFPMRAGVAGESTDHEHHKSVWLAHGNVNGLDFWSEQARIANVSVESLCDAANWPGFVATNVWLDHDKTVITERATYRFCDLGDVRFVDCLFELRAETDVRFSDTKEGTFAIRTRPELQLAREDAALPVAHAENSAGQTDRNVWGQRAEWVSYFGQVDGSPIGVAIFDHPDNLRHPTTWHAREYGLVAANPFGLHDFLKEPPGSGDYELAHGQQLNLHYRLAIYRGEFQRERIAQWFHEFESQR